jgi:hypothetical protein
MRRKVNQSGAGEIVDDAGGWTSLARGWRQRGGMPQIPLDNCPFKC